MVNKTVIPPLITIGETMAMVTPTRAESLTSARNFSVTAGGAESNVASQASDLGVASAWISALGDDALGRRIYRSIESRGVDARWVSYDPNAPTGVYFKDPGNGVLYYRRGSAASRMNPATIANIPIEEAQIVHVSGITPALSASCGALMDAVFTRLARSTAAVSFDVNYRPSLWKDNHASSVLRSLAQRADIVFVGLDEARVLWGVDNAEEVRAVLPEPARLVVKDGHIGVTEFTAEDSIFAPAIPTEVVEAVGAGDAFAAGYLAALLRGDVAHDRLRSGHEHARLALLSTDDTGVLPITHKDQYSDAR